MDLDGILILMVCELPLGQLTDTRTTALVTDTVSVECEFCAMATSKPASMVSPGLTVKLPVVGAAMITLCALAAGVSQRAETEAMSRATITRVSIGNVLLTFIPFLLEECGLSPGVYHD